MNRPAHGAFPAMSNRKLLIIADDHPHVREALEALIARFHDGTTLYTGEDAAKLRSLAESQLADVRALSLVDIRGPAAPADTETCGPLMVVSLQDAGITANWFAAIQGGSAEPPVTGIRDALDRRELVMELIRSLQVAQRHAGAPATQETLAAVASPESLMQLGLTERQAEVLSCLAEGLTNKEIARRLAVSEWTVRHHVSAILERLEVSNRGRAAMFARQLAAD